MTYDFVEGTTADLQFQLLENGEPIDLTGITPTLIISDREGVSLNGTATVVDALTGRVSFNPVTGWSGTFSASTAPYFVRWKLTVNSGGAISFIPSTSRDVWNVVGL